MKISVKHIRDAAAWNRLLSNLKDPKPLLKRIGQNLEDSTIARLVATKESPSGSPWAPWASGTAKARARTGNSGNGLLYNSGRLIKSIKHEVRGNTVTVGSDPSAPYASFLQNGTKNMPARPFVGISRGDQDNIFEIVKRSFRGK